MLVDLIVAVAPDATVRCCCNAREGPRLGNKVPEAKADRAQGLGHRLRETAGRRPCSRCSRGLQEFAHAPYVIGDPRLHGGGYSQGFVYAAEVEECEPQRVSRSKVLPLFTESVRESCHAAHAHANRKVLPFDVRRGNASHIRLAMDRCSDRGSHFWW